jgi:hypothetical protein
MTPAFFSALARFFAVVGCLTLATQFGWASLVSIRARRTNWLMITLCASYSVMATDYFIGLLNSVRFDQTGVSIAPDSLPWLIVKAAAALTAGAVVFAWERAKAAELQRDPNERTRKTDSQPIT